MTVPNQHPKIGELIQFIKSDGTVFDLNSPPSRGILNMSGWGKPPDERHTISGPYQHGETMVSYRLKPRPISMDIVHKYTSRSELLAGRSNLLNQMGLNNASSNAPVAGTLRWEFFENGVHKIRCLDVFLSKGLGFTPLNGWREWTVAEGLEFTAHNPVVYDPTDRTSVISTYTATLIFPVTFPFVLGTSYGTSTITYTGTWEDHPTITITGPAVGIYIENLGTGKKIRLDYTISLGETVTLVLGYNNITVTNNLNDDLLSYVSDDSDLGEFSILYDPVLTGGTNIIVVYTIGATATTTFTFTYHNRYYGI